VVDDEGSRSRKAIAFINSKGNIRLAKSYSERCMYPQRETAFSPANIENRPDAILGVNAEIGIGEVLWKK
jgi:hypothetical protein